MNLTSNYQLVNPTMNDDVIETIQKIGASMQTIDNNMKSHENNINTHGTRLDSIDTQLNDIAIDIKMLNVVPNDNTKATANAIAINNFFSTNTNKTLLCTNDIFYIDDTIIATGTNKLLGQQSTKFILTTTNKDAFRLKPFASIEKISIELPANHNMAGIKIGNNDDFTQWGTHFLSYVKDIFIYGNVSGLSTGIWCEAINGYNVSNFTAENVTIMNCYYGIYVIKSGNGWVNGNNFINVYPQNCYYGIYNQGNGNKFIYSIQAGTISVSKTGVFCGGNENTFIGMTWDLKSGQYSIETDYNSQNNSFIGDMYTPDVVQTYVNNRGTNNIFVGHEIIKGLPNPWASYRYMADDNSAYASPSWAQHYGILDDRLSFCDKTFTVTTSNGDGGIYARTIADTFNNNGGIIFKNTSSANPITIEIISPSALSFVDVFGIGFGGGYIPSNVKIEYASSSGGAYVTALNTTNNHKEILPFCLSAYGGTVQKLKFTLSGGIINSSINPNGYICVSNIFLYQRGYEGNFFVSRKGGNIYGDITFDTNHGAIIKDTTNGHTYRIISTNGAIGLQQVT